jgi:SAM-dependent methyltransferase
MGKESSMPREEAAKASFNLRLAPPGLNPEHFRQVAVRGLGDGQNSYAHSMAWFKGRLYVGSTRNTLCLLKRKGRALPPPEMECWPVIAQDPMPPERMRAEIWRFDPARESWEQVYRSPMITRNGTEAMRDLGYRGMVVFQGRNDPGPALYVASVSGTGMRILRSLDGEHFTEVGPPGMGDPKLASCRSLLAWRGRLYATPAGTEGKNPNESENPVIFESLDPALGQWRTVCEPGFGDSGNRAVAEMCVFDEHLYAGTLNPKSGFQLWKTKGEGEPPYTWTRVLSSGAYRGYLNEATASLYVFDGLLYVGTGIAGGGYNRYHKIGPAPAELVRVFPDGTWDLLVGSARITPHGMKVPLSGLGPGFGHALNGYMWRMCEHEGWLYVGTYNAATWFPYIPVKVPEDYLKFLKLRDTEELVTRHAGCQLWRTQDGEHFQPVITDGFGTRYNFGVRQLASTPYGLFAGTANPFGPEVGVKRDGKWSYEPNPRGGFEVWLGSRTYEGEPLQVARHRKTAVRHQRQAMASVARLFMQWVYAHLTEMGYWRDDTESAREACENLVEELLRFLPDGNGSILDVGCAQGATTETLLRRFPAEKIVGIDTNPAAVDVAQRRLPGVEFRLMPLTRIDFPDGTFSNVICIEGACYIDTRRAFLREAYRVLESGGRLLLSDLLYSRTGEVLSPERIRQNYVRDPRAYKDLLTKEGFKDIQILDVTDACARRYQAEITRHLTRRFRDRSITEGDFSTLMGIVSRHALFLTHYLLATATKL